MVEPCEFHRKKQFLRNVPDQQPDGDGFKQPRIEISELVDSETHKKETRTRSWLEVLDDGAGSLLAAEV